MEKIVKLTTGGKVQMPENFIYTAGKGQKVKVYWGKNNDIAIVTSMDKQLNKDNADRITILTDR